MYRLDSHLTFTDPDNFQACLNVINLCAWFCLSEDIKKELEERSLGIFSTAEDAHQAYKKAANKHFGEFARHNDD